MPNCERFRRGKMSSCDQLQEIADKLRADISVNRLGYVINGKKYPRVTTILGEINKPQLNAWRVKKAVEMFQTAVLEWKDKDIRVTQDWVDALAVKAKGEPDRIAGEAAGIGTAVHSIIEKIMVQLAGNPGKTVQDVDFTGIPGETIPAIESWLAWKKSCPWTFGPAELCVWSDVYGYAGKFDGLVHDGKDIALIDWKTSSNVSGRGYEYQLAAYAMAILEHTGVEVKTAYAIHVPCEQEENVEVWRVVDLVKAFNAFAAALEIRNAGKLDLMEKIS
ncbi:MAG: hypothetical protein QME66_05910 [Candidatus Eisenbacteria bacterium]|nr:hypothetical protein [Candidatus Eisenbacteria bacterium]